MNSWGYLGFGCAFLNTEHKLVRFLNLIRRLPYSLILNREDSVLQDILHVVGLAHKVQILAFENCGIALEHLLVLVLDLGASGVGKQTGNMGVLGDAVLQFTKAARFRLM